MTRIGYGGATFIAIYEEGMLRVRIEERANSLSNNRKKRMEAYIKRNIRILYTSI